jgi:hypothetical protein
MAAACGERHRFVKPSGKKLAFHRNYAQHIVRRLNADHQAGKLTDVLRQ